MIRGAPPEPGPLDPLRGERILLTGASGFIGRHVLERLLELGVEVHATTRHREPPEDLAGREGVVWHRCDLGDADSTLDTLGAARPRRILHLASRVSGARDPDLVLETFRDNLASTVHLLAGAERAHCARMVQVGSLEEPAGAESSEPPSSPYAAAKAAASAYARMYHRLWKTQVTLARVFMVYGPGRQDERKLVPYVIRSLLDGRNPRLSSGTRPIDWVYVGDVVEGLLRLLIADGVTGRTVDLGRGELLTVREVVEAIYARLRPRGTPHFGDLEDRQAEQVRKAAVDATRELLDWAPPTEIGEGLDATIAWFRDHPRPD
ncbi:MAG: NAD(P)-dependent oxidoreductase [Acidobacteriota bacterium]